jgi:hypothetical protein
VEETNAICTPKLIFSIKHEKRKRLWWHYYQTLYVVERDYRFTHLDGNEYTIPEGFISDGASVPWVVRSIYPQNGPWMKDAVKHDFLYDNRIGTRLLADIAFLSDMVSNPLVKNSTAELFFNAVRIGGKRWWND